MTPEEQELLERELGYLNVSRERLETLLATPGDDDKFPAAAQAYVAVMRRLQEVNNELKVLERKQSRPAQPRPQQDHITYHTDG